MKFDFSFSVGENERHVVHFMFDQMSGKLVITVDGAQEAKELRLLSLSLTKEYRFKVGEKEKHDVAIVKRRKLLLAGFRPQTCKVFVDGQPAAEYTSS